MNDMEDVNKIHAIFTNTEIADLDEHFDSYLVELNDKTVGELFEFPSTGRSIRFSMSNGICEIIKLGYGFEYTLDLMKHFTNSEIIEINKRFSHLDVIVNIDINELTSGFKKFKLGSGIEVWYIEKVGEIEICNIVNCIKSNKKDGMKFDDDKLLCMAMPAVEYKQVLEVLTNGANKYKIDNWKHVDDARNRYMNGLERHFLDYKEAIQTGNNELKFDNGEGGMGTHHLANLICNAIFLMYFDNNDIDI